MDLTFLSTVLIFFILLASCLVGAVAAYGSNLLALPLLLCILQDVDTVVAVLLIAGTVQAGHLAWLNMAYVSWKKLSVFLGLCLVGAPLGLWGSHVLPEKELLTAVGVVLIVSGAVPLLWAVVLKLPAVIAHSLLVFGGLIHGAFGTGGGPVVMAARSLLEDKLAFRATLFLFWTIINVLLVLTRGLTGRIEEHMFLLSLVALPALFLGNFLGQRIALWLSRSMFDRLVGLVLMLAGVMTIVQAWGVV